MQVHFRVLFDKKFLNNNNKALYLFLNQFFSIFTASIDKNYISKIKIHH